ncbi:hypothetical protein, partial [Nocardia abscessus]|uniref:hypothetical protein n=1 Tax=Nocardia abscessus TaxID=120957 RepID=UPI002457BCB9
PPPPPPPRAPPPPPPATPSGGAPPPIGRAKAVPTGRGRRCRHTVRRGVSHAARTTGKGSHR